MTVLTRIVSVALSPAIAGVGDEEVTEEDGGSVQVLVLEGGGCLDVVVVLLGDGQHPGVQFDTGNTVNACISRLLYQGKINVANDLPFRSVYLTFKSQETLSRKHYPSATITHF